MKKNIYTFLIILTLPIFTFGQFTFDSFESYSVGAFDTQWNNSIWTGFQGIYSNCQITETEAFSGTKSLSVINPSSGGQYADIVGYLSTVDSQMITIAFMQKIKGRGAVGLTTNYNNNPSSYEWLTVLNYDFGTSSIRVGTSWHTFGTLTDTWAENRFELNFEIDSGYFYYDNQLIVTWGLTEDIDGNTINSPRVNAINFYTPGTSGGRVYYDDIRAVEYNVSTKKTFNKINELSVFPNPVQDKLSIHLNVKNTSTVYYQLTDAIGQVVKYWSVEQVGEIISEQDVSDLVNGLYFLTVRAGDEVKTKKVVISK